MQFKTTRLNRLTLLLALSLAVPAAAHAQTAVYAEFTGASLSVGLPHIDGGTFGVYSQKTLGMVALGLDLRGFAQSGSNGQSYQGVVAGPRIVFKPRVLPFMPYMELLGGVSRVNVNTSGEDKDLAYNAVFGVDSTVIPHVEWRAIEYTYGEERTIPITYKALSTGIVVRF
ncbi:MAG TPA: hypothetical protein VNU94_06385 [Acidobacteriaceae bacterium]|nr:hypothetical protein [Acidobacteriaceae bacterium]